jgi:O-acetyl-ADP-ribose deacetylase (regulator of RNase III)
MIKFVRGNIFESGLAALVNPVNCEGVMGKGLAFAFKEKFPDNYEQYRAACKRGGGLTVGKCFAHQEKTGIWIINFPTKLHWRNPSKLEWIKEGLDDMVRLISELDIPSAAVPALGCGLGGLSWFPVKTMITDALNHPLLKDKVFYVYEP